MFTNIRSTQTMTVRAISQSKDGCVWFAAGKSLYSFDGMKIRTVCSDVLDRAGAIGCIAELENERMLIGCERGLVVYEREGNRCEGVEGLEGLNVRSIILNGDDEWLGTNKGLYRNRKLVDGKLDVISLFMQGEKLLVACMDKMKEYDVCCGKMTDLPMPSFGFVTCFYGDKDGGVMAGTVNGVCSYDVKKKVLKPLPSVFPVVKCIMKDSRGKMAKLECDKSSLQQQLHLQQLSAQSQNNDEEKSDDEVVSVNDQFIIKVTRIIEENIDNPELSVSLLSEKLGISSKQLYRRVKQCTDLTAVEYIRKLRLQKAALLLKNPEFTINEVMYMVGFSNPSYFSRSFASEYGMPPSEWRN